MSFSSISAPVALLRSLWPLFSWLRIKLADTSESCSWLNKEDEEKEDEDEVDEEEEEKEEMKEGGKKKKRSKSDPPISTRVTKTKHSRVHQKSQPTNQRYDDLNILFV
ncbi:hypothetical protein M0802_003539 [Mischocyttarus mexicanus]|nr:hypothetical protein M0802_003539 [Mischocyttarus mexicanus]